MHTSLAFLLAAGAGPRSIDARIARAQTVERERPLSRKDAKIEASTVS